MKLKIAVIGLGYVGLPLTIAFGETLEVVGFDTDHHRINELQKGFDRNNECSEHEILSSMFVRYTVEPTDLAESNVYIVTVPTPVDRFKTPDLSNLLAASKTIGRVLKPGDLVIYESTVYPGCTEEDCIPVLEGTSHLGVNSDFFVGYSPERINPGDKVNTLRTIRKVVSGSSPEAAARVKSIYDMIIKAGTYQAASIRVAEASKVIENAQRDLNISFMNELALIFDKMGLDTTDVLEAAGTKWNFLPFSPGLVGGHCIGIDPYYLTHKAESLGYFPQVILSGRRINENMGSFISGKVVKMMIRKGQRIEGAHALILGFTFKENCSDIRNSRVIDIYRELTEFGMHVDVFDPNVDANEVLAEYSIDLIDHPNQVYDAIILAVAHTQFTSLDISVLRNSRTVVFDTKSFWARSLVDSRL